MKKKIVQDLPLLNHQTIVLESIRSELNQYIHRMHFDQAKRIEKRLEILEKKVKKLEVFLGQDERTQWLREMMMPPSLASSLHASENH